MNIFDIEETKNVSNFEHPYAIIRYGKTYILKENIEEKIEILIKLHKEIEQDFLKDGDKALAQISVAKIDALATLLEIIRRV